MLYREYTRRELRISIDSDQKRRPPTDAYCSDTRRAPPSICRTDNNKRRSAVENSACPPRVGVRFTAAAAGRLRDRRPAACHVIPADLCRVNPLDYPPTPRHRHHTPPPPLSILAVQFTDLTAPLPIHDPSRRSAHPHTGVLIIRLRS